MVDMAHVAGLDTFGYRNPRRDVRVFEVDQPDTQALKRQRLQSAAITPPENLVFVPCDFSRDDLSDVLDTSGFDHSLPAVFAWLGVVMYLEKPDVVRSLRYIAGLPIGSRVIFDYALPPELFPSTRRAFYVGLLDRLAEGTAQPARRTARRPCRAGHRGLPSRQHG